MTELIISAVIFVALIGVAAFFFKSIIIGWLGGGGGSVGPDPKTGPSDGSHRNTDHSSSSAHRGAHDNDAGDGGSASDD